MTALKTRSLIVAALTLGLLLALAPSPSRGQGKQGGALERAARVQDRRSERLLARPGVVGTAVTENRDGQAVIKVFTVGAGVAVKRSFGGVKVNRDVTGRIRALHHRAGHGGGPPGGGGGGSGGGDAGLSSTDRWPRPVPIGISTGNVGECSAGTIGARVSGAGGTFALSNNHVYALENDASIGSDVLQPGRYDTGCAVDPADVIGQLADYEPLVFGGAPNTMDAAIASTGALGTSTPSDGYGSPSGQVAAASVGLDVQKYGRTTQLTTGTVTALNATIDVGYDSGTARFVDQVIVEGRKPVLKPGDSGSLAVTRSGRDAVGLLFAANSSGKFSIANEISAVLDRFGVTIDGS